eukprot:gene2484-3074_t
MESHSISKPSSLFLSSTPSPSSLSSTNTPSSSNRILSSSQSVGSSLFGLPISSSTSTSSSTSSQQQLQALNLFTTTPTSPYRPLSTTSPAATSPSSTTTANSTTTITKDNITTTTTSIQLNGLNSESLIYLNGLNGNPLIRIKVKQNSPNSFNLEVDSNETYDITLQNNTKRYYFRGIINSIGKVPTICEDSHFLSKDFTAVGVADGVGAWRSMGIDSGQYSRFLMSSIFNLSGSSPQLKPFELIEQAYLNSANIPGSSTICILKLIGTKIYSGLIGDSSYLIIRNNSIIHRSKEQTHKPNHPFQLGQGSSDTPSSGLYEEHQVLENDIIVIGTDGFFDNVFDEEVLGFIKKVDTIESFFNHLLEFAKQKSTDTNANTPIGFRNSQKGGKPDDITVDMKFVATLLIAITLLALVSAINYDEPLITNKSVRDINKQHLSWKAKKHSKFASMTVGEAMSLLGAQKPINTPEEKPLKVGASIPASFDSRTQWPGCVHAILNQGQCGSCWAFAASESLSDRLCIASGGKINVTLSPQALVSCDRVMNNGCNGGIPQMAWEYLELEGIPTLSCFPYTAGANGTDGPCLKSCADGSNYKRYQAKKFTLKTCNSVESIQQNIMTYGPIEGTFTVYQDFMSYSSGVYVKSPGSALLGGHAIKIIGWGTDSASGLDYWLVANSWGTDWGIDGFFMIERGTNMCGIDRDASASQASV